MLLKPSPAGSRRARFGAWYRQRPFIGGVLTMLAGIEIFFSGQLDVGKIHVQVGIEGLQATIIPVLLVLLGLLAILMPVHRIFYGVIALALAAYSLIGVNLGGFFVGMLLGSVGGVLTVSWMPKVRAAGVVSPVVEGPVFAGPAFAGPAFAAESTDATSDSSEESPEALPLVHGRN